LKTAKVIALFCLILSIWSLNAFAHPLTGKDIAQRVFDRDRGEDSYSRVEMILIDKKGKTRVREMIVERKDYGKLTKTLFRFTSPADIEGTGFLSWENEDRDDDQFLYLPALRRTRRIVSSQKDMRFVNTDFTYEDLERRKVEKDHHRLLGTDKVNGYECWILESIPKKDSGSQYGRIVSWIVKEIYVPIKAEYYDKKGRMIKRFMVKKLEKIENIWTEMDLEMADLKNNHKTQLIIKEVHYNTGLSDNVFTRRNLERY